MVYAWKEGARVKANAQTAGEIFERLAAEGRLTPADLVRESKPEDAPLHKEFEWDDEKAAQAYRETRARELIRFIVIKPEQKADVPIRAFFRADSNLKNTYEPVNLIIADVDKYAYLLRQALAEMEAFVRKYSVLTELKPVTDVMEQALSNSTTEVMTDIADSVEDYALAPA